MTYTKEYIDSLTDEFIPDGEGGYITWRQGGNDELFQAIVDLCDHSALTDNIRAAYYDMRYRPERSNTYIVRGVYQLDDGNAFMICVRDPNKCTCIDGIDPDQYLMFLEDNFRDLYELYFLEDLGNRVVVSDTGCCVCDFIPIAGESYIEN
jgi:hypothetical protein